MTSDHFFLICVFLLFLLGLNSGIFAAIFGALLTVGGMMTMYAHLLEAGKIKEGLDKPKNP